MSILGVAERRRPERAIWWIIGIAFILRLIAIPIFGSDPANRSLYEYGRIAINIVQGHGFSFDFAGRYPLQYTAYSPALYCYTLVPWYWLFGVNFLGPRIMHAAFLATACWFLYKIGTRLVNRRVGLIAAAIWAVYPELVFLSIRIAPENVMFLPMLWMLWKATAVDPPASRRGIFGAGALLGLSCWVNPSLQVLGLAVPLHWGINGLFKRKAGLQQLVLFWLGAVLVIAPWTIRNYIRLGAFVPLRSAFAYNFWRGNHPGATGTVRNFDFECADEKLPPEYLAYIDAHLDPRDEIQRDRFFADEVKRFIQENPDEYLRLCLTRFFYYWWRDKTHSLTGNIWYLGPWLLTLIFAAYGGIRIRSRWKEWSVWILQILGFTALFALTIVVPRYRMPMYPALFLLAAVGADEFLNRFLNRKIPIPCEK